MCPRRAPLQGRRRFDLEPCRISEVHTLQRTGLVCNWISLLVRSSSSPKEYQHLQHPHTMCTCGHVFDVMKSTRLSRVTQEKLASGEDLAYPSAACNNQYIFAFDVVSQHHIAKMLILCEPALLSLPRCVASKIHHLIIISMKKRRCVNTKQFGLVRGSALTDLYGKMPWQECERRLKNNAKRRCCKMSD